MMLLNRPRLALATSLILVLGGCGANPDKPTAAESPATAVATIANGSHDEFITELNRTCDADKGRLDTIGALADDRLAAGDYDGAADAFQDALDLAESYWKRQRELQPPAEDAAAFKTYMATQHQMQGMLRRYVTALRKQDDKTIQFLIRATEDLRADRLKAAVAIGADDCGQ